MPIKEQIVRKLGIYYLQLLAVSTSAHSHDTSFWHGALGSANTKILSHRENSHPANATPNATRLTFISLPGRTSSRPRPPARRSRRTRASSFTATPYPSRHTHRSGIRRALAVMLCRKDICRPDSHPADLRSPADIYPADTRHLDPRSRPDFYPPDICRRPGIWGGSPPAPRGARRPSSSRPLRRPAANARTNARTHTGWPRAAHARAA